MVSPRWIFPIAGLAVLLLAVGGWRAVTWHDTHGTIHPGVVRDIKTYESTVVLPWQRAFSSADGAGQPRLTPVDGHLAQTRAGMAELRRHRVTGRFAAYHAAFLREHQLGVARLEALRAAFVAAPSGEPCVPASHAAVVAEATQAYNVQSRVKTREWARATGTTSIHTNGPMNPSAHGCRE